MKSKKSFTLIELLLVIAIITILSGILLPTLGKIKARVIAINCLGNARQLSIGMMTYANDNNGFAMSPDVVENKGPWEVEPIAYKVIAQSHPGQHMPKVMLRPKYWDLKNTFCSARPQRRFKYTSTVPSDYIPETDSWSTGIRAGRNNTIQLGEDGTLLTNMISSFRLRFVPDTSKGIYSRVERLPGIRLGTQPSSVYLGDFTIGQYTVGTWHGMGMEANTLHVRPDVYKNGGTKPWPRPVIGVFAFEDGAAMTEDYNKVLLQMGSPVFHVLCNYLHRDNPNRPYRRKTDY